jgi:ABC-type dipeptide/oligopeptide/nickel transport system permease subunit
MINAASPTATPTSGRSWTLAHRIAGHPEGRIGLALLALLAIAGLLGPLMLPHRPNQINAQDALQAPSARHWFGTDELGRDQFSRVIGGAPIAFYVSGGSVAIALVIGTAIGLIAGYTGGFVDTALSWFISILFSMPALLLALVIVGAFGPGLNNALIAVAIVYIPRFARIARASTLSVRHRLYIEAARLAGRTPREILLEHVLPSIMPAIIVQTALSLSTAELAHASLSFLGLGVQPPTADWGNMLAKARGLMTVAPWLVIFPAAALVLLIIGFNTLGDALRDVLDPRRQTGAMRTGV